MYGLLRPEGSPIVHSGPSTIHAQPMHLVPEVWGSAHQWIQLQQHRTRLDAVYTKHSEDCAEHQLAQVTVYDDQSPRGKQLHS